MDEPVCLRSSISTVIKSFKSIDYIEMKYKKKSFRKNTTLNKNKGIKIQSSYQTGTQKGGFLMYDSRFHSLEYIEL